MFYANLRLTNDKVSYYVMHKHMIIDAELLAKKFQMDASSLKFQARSFPNYRKEFTIDRHFPYRTPTNLSGKALIAGLSLED